MAQDLQAGLNSVFILGSVRIWRGEKEFVHLVDECGRQGAGLSKTFEQMQPM